MKEPLRPERNYRSGFLMALLMLIFPLAVHAQTGSGGSLTLKEAIQYALSANQEARKARLDVENAGYQINEVRSRALPQINGSANLSYNPILQLSAVPGELAGQPGTTLLIPFGQKWNANAAVSLSQTLFDQSVFTGLKAAKTTRDFYRLNEQLTEEQIIEQVATQYYRILVQRQQVAVLDSTIENTARVQNILKGQYENGLARKIDVDRIEVSLSNLRNTRQQLSNGVTLLENQLKFLMGMPIQQPVQIPDAALASIEPKLIPSDASVNLNSRTELQLLQSQEQLLNYQKQAFKAEFMPSLSLGSTYSYQGLGQRFPIFRSREEGANWFDVASVSLTLRVPIFNGFATQARVRQANVSLRKLQEDISAAKLGLNLEFENAKTQINNSIITLNSQEKNVDLAREVYSNTQNNYNNGLASLTDLLSAENELTEAQNNYSSALLDYKVAEIQLIKAQGSLKNLVN